MQADGFHNFSMGGDGVDSDSENSIKLQDRDGFSINQRTSLLGRPLNFKNRRDAKYRKLQAMTYNFLERPSGKLAFLYHGCVFIAVFLCLAMSIFSTIDEYEDYAAESLFYLETVIVFWFGIEFFVRLWSAGCRSRFQGWIGRMHFMKSPFCLIDIITLSASLIVLSGLGERIVAASALRGLRFFQILRMVRMDRRGGTWKLLGTVIYAHRQELITTLYIGFLVLVFSSFVIYMVEKEENEKFKSFAHALWWGVITLCTVGYGDTVPVTWKGKIMASFCALCGISFFALPAGILGSGFALKVQQQQRQKHIIRRRVPAATLIQCLWRCYAADENSASEVTWRMHIVPRHRSPPVFKNQSSFVHRLPTLRRGRTRSPSKKQEKTSSLDQETQSVICDETEGGSRKFRQSFKQGLSRTQSKLSRRSLSPNPSGNPSKNHSRNPSRVVSPKTSRGASRASSPFPWNNSVNFNATLPAAPPNNLDNNDPALPLMLCSLLQREFCMKSPSRRQRKNTSSKDEDEEEEEEDALVPIVLTPQHKGAIRTIRKLKYMVARRKFKEALRPYDVKDVIESYSAGHADLVTKVKNLSGRLDQILGREGMKGSSNYDSTKCSLAHRIVNTERQVDNIEEKLQLFIDMYEEDRKRMNAFAYAIPQPPPCTPCPETPLSAVSPPSGYHMLNSQQQNFYTSVSQGLQNIQNTSVYQPKLRGPKHSEPGTPTNETLKEKSVIHVKRPFKKRVTLGHIPSKFTKISQEALKPEESCSLSNIVPPSVRIEGCTPPSENNSVDGEMFHYLRDNLSESSDLTIYMDNNTSFDLTSESGHTTTNTTTSTGPEIVITSSPSQHRNLTNTFSAPPYFGDTSPKVDDE